ncbi:MAG TPA: DUF3071 domain-containing protein [Intrasporangiaceae bacterium]|nr:DUF3071 domain-containing protein [Intrasporangiaceae bacterium]
MGQGQTQLRLIGVHDSGEYLLLSDGDGGRYLLPLDETLKAAARRDRPRMGQLQIEIDGAIRPAEVQSLLRTGLTAEEIADRTGWSAERIRRYEWPVIAERDHAARLAREQVYVRTGPQPLTLGDRVTRRLAGRGVDPEQTVWDATRSPEGNWTVTATFPAGGRERVASWYFDLAGRSVVPADDEARWLTEEDVPSGPIPVPHPPPDSEHPVTVFDVEADGGISSPRRELPAPIDLMQAMRDGSSVRSRRRRRRGAPSPTDLPLEPAEDALPLEELGYDPATMGDPPGARGEHPDDPPPEAEAEVEDAAAAEAEYEVEPEAESDLEDVAAEDAESAAEPEESADAPADDETRPAPRPKGKRPSVPSWDDIMFGSRPPSQG